MDTILSRVYSKHRLKRYFFLIVGVLICAATYNIFMLPNNIVFGGVSGLGIIGNHYLGVKPAVFMLGCSFVLCLFGFALLPKKIVARSVLAAILYPIFVELTSFLSDVIVIENADMLVIAIFGGVFYGLGAGIIYKYGFTLGGTDFITEVLHRYFKMTIGTAMMIVEGVIVLIGAFTFGVTNCLYAIVILYLLTFLIDKVMLGISNKKAFYIVTSEQDKVSDFVIKELGHTITVFSAKGGFTNKKVSVLFTVVPTKEYYRLKEGISLIDEEAFFTVVDAYEVSGGE